ncbi:MAG: right-handed parallel beta-helix repeat-containing protein [Kiritimatiellae bacterium]|nr:right-handed parallel beta-helix repeat-containing protein [Verrucomicrobiota bacterium]MCG2659288.1 right-handed parallel beta-helix repeat-containing protein [Kiritimatiellia bacterium]
MKRQMTQRTRAILAGVVLSWAAATLWGSAQMVTNITQATGSTTITGAIAAANAGDVLEVYNGTYVENVVINKNLITVRAAAGQNPVVSPGSGYGVNVSSLTCTVERLEITGTGVTEAIVINAAGARIINNYIHDLLTNGTAWVYGIEHVAGNDPYIVSNRIANLSNASGSYLLCIRARSPMSGLWCAGNTISNISGAATSYGIYLEGKDMIARNNRIVNVRHPTTSFGSIYVATSASNTLVEGNYMDGGTNSGVCGVYLAGSYVTVHDNDLRNCSYSGLLGWAPGDTKDVVIQNNRLISDVNASFRMCRMVYASRFALSNNLFVQRANLAGGNTLYSADSVATNCTYSRNTFIRIPLAPTSPWSGIGTDSTTNFFSGNFYGLAQAGGGWDYGVASPAPFSVPPGGNMIDSSAVTGYWARVAVPSNTASTAVGNPSNTNQLGQPTRVVFNTTYAADRSDTNGPVFFDIAANLRAGAAAPADQPTARNAGRTLQVAPMFEDGEFFMTVQMAYNQAAVFWTGSENTLALYRFNTRSYTNQFWTLAVNGNLTNSYFPSNSVQLVLGAPDGVLGHYGVDTVNNVVWANVNYAGSDFGAFQAPPPAGTVFMGR